MPPKKNGFFMFMKNFRLEQMKLGKEPTSYKDLSTKLSPLWAGMTADEKNLFKTQANDYNSKLKEANKESPNNLLDTSFHICNIKDLYSDILSSVSNKEELLQKKLILVHVNLHAFVKENYYFPAEIAALEFNLKKGVLRRYHSIVGVANTYPRGMAGGMRQYSDLFHNISCWEKEHSDDYKGILTDFLTFLKGGTKHDAEVYDSNLDLPDVFTIESEPGQNLMAVKSSLDRLCRAAFPDNFPLHCKSIFNVKSIERLFLEIIKKLNLHLNPLTIKAGNSVHDVLESNLFGKGLSCQYHEMRDVSYKCSSARVLQWMTNMLQHLHNLGDLEIIPGFHVPVTLRDGTKLFIDHTDIPLSSRELKISLGSLIFDDDDDQLRDIQEKQSNFTQCFRY